MGYIIKLFRNPRVKWVLVLLWMGLIFALSNMDSVKSWYITGKTLAVVEQTVEVTDEMTFDEEISLYSEHESQMHILRKMAHIFLYIVLGFLLANALYQTDRKRRFALVAFVSCILYAVFDEAYQLTVPGRTGSVGDVVIDAIGSIIGILVFYLIAYYGNQYLLKKRLL